MPKHMRWLNSSSRKTAKRYTLKKHRAEEQKSGVGKWFCECCVCGRYGSSSGSNTDRKWPEKVALWLKIHHLLMIAVCTSLFAMALAKIKKQHRRHLPTHRITNPICGISTRHCNASDLLRNARAYKLHEHNECPAKAKAEITEEQSL